MTTEKAVPRGEGTRGFTLVEAMVAVFVLAVAAAAVLLPFVSGAAVQAEGGRMTLGAELASSKMEEIINTPFNNIAGSIELQGQVIDLTTNPKVPFTDPRYANFSRTVTCEYVAASPQTVPRAQYNFIRVTVQVKYNGKETATIRRLVSE